MRREFKTSSMPDVVFEHWAGGVEQLLVHLGAVLHRPCKGFFFFLHLLIVGRFFFFGFFLINFCVVANKISRTVETELVRKKNSTSCYSIAESSPSSSPSLVPALHLTETLCSQRLTANTPENTKFEGRAASGVELIVPASHTCQSADELRGAIPYFCLRGRQQRCASATH